jgi:hypothetical protein
MHSEIDALMQKEKKFNQTLKKAFMRSFPSTTAISNSLIPYYSRYDNELWKAHIKTKYNENSIKYKEFTEEIFLIFETTIHSKEKFKAIKTAFNELSPHFNCDKDWADHLSSIVIMLSRQYLNMLEFTRMKQFITKFGLSLEEALAVIYYLVEKGCITQYINLSHDKNTLLAIQVITQFSTANKIRVEDTIKVFAEYVNSNKVMIDAINSAVHATQFTDTIAAIL